MAKEAIPRDLWDSWELPLWCLWSHIIKAISSFIILTACIYMHTHSFSPILTLTLVFLGDAAMSYVCHCHVWCRLIGVCHCNSSSFYSSQGCCRINWMYMLQRFGGRMCVSLLPSAEALVHCCCSWWWVLFTASKSQSVWGDALSSYSWWQRGMHWMLWAAYEMHNQ